MQFALRTYTRGNSMDLPKLFDKLVLQIRSRVSTGPKNLAHHVGDVGGDLIQAHGPVTKVGKVHVSVVDAETVPALAAEITRLLGPQMTRSQLVWSEPPALPTRSHVEIVPGGALSIIKAHDPAGEGYLRAHQHHQSGPAQRSASSPSRAAVSCVPTVAVSSALRFAAYCLR